MFLDDLQKVVVFLDEPCKVNNLKEYIFIGQLFIYYFYLHKQSL